MSEVITTPSLRLLKELHRQLQQAYPSIDAPDIPSYIQGKNVVILGGPASGKSFLAWQLMGSESHEHVSTDYYMTHGFEQSLYMLLDDIKYEAIPTPHIIEGVIGARLIRKGAEWGTYYPDVIIELRVSDDRLEREYVKRGEDKLKGARAMTKSIDTILNAYRSMPVPSDKKPIWITINNEY